MHNEIEKNKEAEEGVNKKTSLKKWVESADASLMLKRPDPPERPEINSDLEEMPGWERGGEVLIYWVRRFEYFLSPRGGLRYFWKIMISIGIMLATPLIILTFLAPLLTFLTGAAAASMEALYVAARAFFRSTAYLLITAGVLYCAYKLIMQLKKAENTNRKERRDYK